MNASAVATCVILGAIFLVLLCVFVSILRQRGGSTNMQMLRLDDRIRSLEGAVTKMSADLGGVVEGMKRTERILDAIVHGALDQWAEGHRSERA